MVNQQFMGAEPLSSQMKKMKIVNGSRYEFVGCGGPVATLNLHFQMGKESSPVDFEHIKDAISQLPDAVQNGQVAVFITGYPPRLARYEQGKWAFQELASNALLSCSEPVRFCLIRSLGKVTG